MGARHAGEDLGTPITARESRTARGNANERFFAGLAGAAALVFDEEIEWTIVDVSDAMAEVEIVVVLRERWENKVTSGCK